MDFVTELPPDAVPKAAGMDAINMQTLWWNEGTAYLCFEQELGHILHIPANHALILQQLQTCKQPQQAGLASLPAPWDAKAK